MKTKEPNYRVIAQKRWPKAAWIAGIGQFALVTSCRKQRTGKDSDVTVTLHSTHSKAVFTNKGLFCGGACRGDGSNHEIVNLGSVCVPIQT